MRELKEKKVSKGLVGFIQQVIELQIHQQRIAVFQREVRVERGVGVGFFGWGGGLHLVASAKLGIGASEFGAGFAACEQVGFQVR